MLYSYKLCNILDIGRCMSWERVEERVGVGRNKGNYDTWAGQGLIIHITKIKCPCLQESNFHSPMMAPAQAKVAWAMCPKPIWLFPSSKMAAPTEPSVIAEGSSAWLFPNGHLIILCRSRSFLWV